MAHKGIREWTAEELSNVALGQNGFHLLKGSTQILASDKGIEYWVALKAVGGACIVTAQSVLPGDHLSTDGDYTENANYLTMADGDIVYGAFNAVDINGASDYLVAYIGK